MDLNENVSSKIDNDLGIFKNMKKVIVTGEHGDQRWGQITQGLKGHKNEFEFYLKHEKSQMCFK